MPHVSEEAWASDQGQPTPNTDDIIILPDIQSLLDAYS